MHTRVQGLGVCVHTRSHPLPLGRLWLCCTHPAARPSLQRCLVLFVVCPRESVSLCLCVPVTLCLWLCVPVTVFVSSCSYDTVVLCPSVRVPAPHVSRVGD